MLRIDSKLSKISFLCLVLGLAMPALAQEQQDNPQLTSSVPVRVRFFEGVVTVQRASAGETSEAIPNLPLEAGDRVWTESDGRAELTLSDGTAVWLDQRTTLDIVALEDGRGGSSILRLWGGSVLVWRPAVASLSELRLDGGENVVLLQQPGLARVDIDDERRLWLSVYDGEASLAAGGLVETLAAGERSYTEMGSAPATASAFSTAEVDDFGQWQQERWSAYATTTQYVAQRDYVPQDVQPYAGELEAAGSWFYYDDFGSYAWQPTVAAGWSPYQEGSWVWGYAGWTWAASASWGWATAHYGRWHHLPDYGWVWFPGGGGYQPASVSWYVGYGYVGWSPLGYYGRPFTSFDLWLGGGYGYGYGYHGGYGYTYPSYYGYGYGNGYGSSYPSRYGNGGRAVAGKGYARGGSARPSGWTLIDAADLGRGDAGRRAVSRTALPAGAAQNVATLSGSLRQRSFSALQSGRQAVSRSAGTSQRPALGSGIAAAGRGLSAGSASRPSISSGIDRDGSARSGAAVRRGQSRPAVGSDRGGALTSRAVPRPSISSTGRRTTASAVRPRPGGLSSGLSTTRGAIRRPSATARPGSTTGGLSSGVPRPTWSRSPATSRSGLTSPRSIARRPTMSRSGAGSRPGLSARPQISPRSAPGRSSIGRGSGGPRASAPRGAALRGGGGGRGGGVAAPRGGSRGGARRSGGARRH